MIYQVYYVRIASVRGLSLATKEPQLFTKLAEVESAHTHKPAQGQITGGNLCSDVRQKTDLYQFCGDSPLLGPVYTQVWSK